LAFESRGRLVSAETLHILQVFNNSGTGIIALPPRAFLSAAVAPSAAQIMSHSHVGVVAWSRSFNPDAGEYGEPQEIVRFGRIPEWFDEGGGVE
jgi:hypothetical protein